jgi:hypothetical protein
MLLANRFDIIKRRMNSCNSTTSGVIYPQIALPPHNPLLPRLHAASSSPWRWTQRGKETRRAEPRDVVWRSAERTAQQRASNSPWLLKHSRIRGRIEPILPRARCRARESGARHTPVKGNGVATLAQNKIFPAKQKLLLSEITGLPLYAQMQRNRLDVDERVEGSRQCSCSRPS